MKSLSVTIFFLFLINVSAIEINGFDYPDDEIKEIITALNSWREYANESKLDPSSERIEKLGLGLRKTSATNIYITGDRVGVRRDLQLALLAIPGHSEHYANKINSLREGYDLRKDDPAKALERNAYGGHLLNAQMYGFRTLQELPSPETIRVLGEFLTDERGRIPPLPDGTVDYLSRASGWGQKPNSVLAARALASMPIRNKPHAPPAFEDDQRPPQEWINWYTQIKEGRRTFSFEGDPNEYNLQGPVNAAINPDIPRESRRNASPSLPEITADSKEESSTSRTPWITAAAITLAALLSWLFLKKRRAI